MERCGKYVLFKYSQNDENLINKLLDFIDKKAGDIYKFFEIDKTNLAVINIIPTKK